MRIHLASRSPRRRELLEQIGIDYAVIDIEVDETRRTAEAACDYVLRVAADKARAGLATLSAQETAPAAAQAAPSPPEPIVLAADTSVVIGTDILGKPDDATDALRMLADLSGREHQVLSGVALATVSGITTALSTSTVRMRETSAEERAAYVATGEPLDKAGAYAIQGGAAVFIEHLEGSYSGVMGLPLFETANLLRDCGALAAAG